MPDKLVPETGKRLPEKAWRLLLRRFSPIVRLSPNAEGYYVRRVPCICKFWFLPPREELSCKACPLSLRDRWEEGENCWHLVERFDPFVILILTTNTVSWRLAWDAEAREAFRSITAWLRSLPDWEEGK